MMQQITWKEFEKVEIRIGTIVSAEDFPEARSPSYKLMIDFGPRIGVKKSSDQYSGIFKPAYPKNT